MSVLGITFNDFGKGKFELHKGIYESAKIQAYIDKYERQYLNKLLGVDLFKDFQLDLVNGIPQEAKYLDIYNEFEYDDANCAVLISDGMLDMIKGFVYFQYLKDQTNTVSVSGNVRQMGENSENVSTLNTMIYTRYNDSIRTYRTIQKYICDNNKEYLKFNGVKLGLAYWL